MLRTNPDSLKSCLCFRVFRLNFASDFFNLLLAGFHQAEIIIVKHLKNTTIQNKVKIQKSGKKIFSYTRTKRNSNRS